MAAPWLRESAPTLVPILLHMLRQRIEGDLCRAAQAAGLRSDGTAYDSPRDPGYERAETEARVWDRE